MKNKVTLIAFETNTAKLANLRRRAGRAGATNIKTVDIEGLQEYSELVKSGGRLVYATCTISREENEEVVNAFLEENKDFSMISPTEINPDIFGRFTAEDGFFRSLPNVHDMDGFFGAVMMREQ